MAPDKMQYGTPIGPLCVQYYPSFKNYIENFSPYTRYQQPRTVNKCLGVVSDGGAGLETKACRLIVLHPHSKHSNRIAFEVRLFKSDLRLYQLSDDFTNPKSIWATEGECLALLCPQYMDLFSLQSLRGSELMPGVPLKDQNG